jgi:C-22 sterol desaturase
MSVRVANASNAQAELAQTWPQSTFHLQSASPGFFAGWSAWQYVLTFLLGVLVYDQGKLVSNSKELYEPDTVSSDVH